MLKLKLAGLSDYKKLSVFDFDDTLFKSPDKPANYSGNWWINKESLNPPYVPEIPDENFWNIDIVNKARKEINTTNTCCILMTGRVGDVFHERITELISQKKLNFYFIKCNSRSEDTENFKIKEIKKILNKFPTIKQIEIWDDDKEKINKYVKEFYNFNIKSNLVGDK